MPLLPVPLRRRLLTPPRAAILQLSPSSSSPSSLAPPCAPGYSTARRRMATQTPTATTSSDSSLRRRPVALDVKDILPTRKAPSSFHGPVVFPNPPKKILVHPPPCPPPPPEPLPSLADLQLKALDPTGQKRSFISRTNRDGLRVGDILQIRFAHRDPFAGVLINLRRRGIDSALLLRNQLTRVGVEMWVKLFSPTVVGIDIVQRAKKRARRARLYYLRDPKHDIGSVQNVVTAYTRQRALLRSGGVKMAHQGAQARKAEVKAGGGGPAQQAPRTREARERRSKQTALFGFVCV
ncbi:translation protein SH3-like domain-containing protein [Kalaharituber pfeilii]|nr:translation protein SH3-like domain-containing protein [Kalaharituber pfeilii]